MKKKKPAKKEYLYHISIVYKSPLAGVSYANCTWSCTSKQLTLKDMDKLSADLEESYKTSSVVILNCIRLA